MKPSSWKGTHHLISKPCHCCRLSIQVLSQPKLISPPGFPTHLLLEAACKALPLLGVLICPWVSSPCVTRVFRKRLFLTECIESLTIVVKSLFTRCGKSFFTKHGESLFTQCGGSRHNFELWCRSSLELFDLWRKMEWKQQQQQTQYCMLLSRNAKSSCYEKWSWAMNNHNYWSDHAMESWTGINSNTWMGRHLGSAEVDCPQLWIPWGCSRWSTSPWCPPTTPPRSSTPPSTLSAPHSAPRNDPSPPGSSSTSQSWQRCKFWQ